MTTATTANFVRRAMASATRRSSTATATATATATGTKPSAVLSVEKITARVFCLGGEGGNPVTIFASQYPLPGSVQRSLAKTCQWESVILTTNDDVPSNNADDTTSMASSSITSSSIASSSIASSSSKSALPSMAFFMPSGEEVSFCAHAAIGLAMGYQQIISRRKQKQTQNNNNNNNDYSSSSLVFQAAMTGESFKIDVGIIDDGNDDDNNQTDDDVTANVTTPVTRSVSANRSSCKSTCRLYMTSQFQEQTLSLNGQKTLKEWSDKLNWSTLLSSSNDENGNDFDNCNSVMWRNASIARPKSLIQLDSIEAVHRAIPPPLPTYDTNSNATTTTTNFADACNIMDDSTGIYVYAPRRYPQQQKQQSNTNNNSDNSNNNNNNNNISFECRQFPRSSGYQEDPATGIAAAALAASLHFGNDNDSDTTIINNNNIVYDIYQGTAMGRPSLIQVVDLRGEENDEEEKNNSDSSPRKNKNKNTNINKDFRISFGLQGKVEIDDHCTIEVLCNDDDDGDGQ